jgi:FAD/FMN-containing dehydrogenase
MAGNSVLKEDLGAGYPTSKLTACSSPTRLLRSGRIEKQQADGRFLMQTRRKFLSKGMLGGAVLAASGGFSVQIGASATSVAATKSLRPSFQGQLILPGDPDYESMRKVVYQNMRTDKLPALIARCAGQTDVVAGLNLAQTEGLPVALLSGGHSFVGWGTLDDGVVIDVSQMRTIDIDPVAQTARVGPGVLSAELVATAAQHGLAPVVAQCSTVGVTGLTLGGGLSYLSGKYGASCDTLLGAELVTAVGEKLACNASENPDLYWALRGGGGNFGVVTSLSFQLFPIGEVVIGSFGYRMEDAPAVVRFFSDYMASAPDELQGWTCVHQDKGDQILLVGLCWSGDLLKGDEAISPFRKIAKPIKDTLERSPYLETFNLYPSIGPGPLNSIAGCYVSQLTDEAMSTFIDQFARLDGSFNCAVGLDHYMHGEICRVAPQATAFDLRLPGAVHVWITANWSDPEAELKALEWADASWRAMKAFSTGRTYANYPAFEDGTLGGAAYNENQARLASIKHRYDPHNLFRRNYNILPEAA